MEKPVSDALQTGSASENCVLVPRAIVSTGKTIVLIAETAISMAEKMFCVSENTFSVSENMFSVSEKMFSVAKTMVAMVNQTFAHRNLERIEQSFAISAGFFWSASPLASILFREIRDQMQLNDYNPTLIALCFFCQPFFNRDVFLSIRGSHPDLSDPQSQVCPVVRLEVEGFVLNIMGRGFARIQSAKSACIRVPLRLLLVDYADFAPLLPA